jgi:2-dehydro-3-deoxy-D-arabinonate dehydratase
MQLVKFQYNDDLFAGVLTNGRIHFFSAGPVATITHYLDSDELVSLMKKTVDSPTDEVDLNDVKLLAPIDQQEVWAAGVTYKRSRTARMEESESAASCYDRVYESPRPEIFFKATPSRVVGPLNGLRIRSDSNWNVPEPEIAMVINSEKKLVGFTVGNDMSSRDIEGDNPLYLPQAKVYDQCCGLGPAITPVESMPSRKETTIELSIHRQGNEVYTGTTDADEMARSFEELLSWLIRDNSFPDGVIMLTGTGIVPDGNFGLEPGDEVLIHIAGIGTLQNHVIQG